MSSSSSQNPLSFLPQTYKPLLLPLLLLLLPLLFRTAYTDYTGWHALGPGGLPHNILGWLVQSLMRLRASSQHSLRDSRCYDDVAMRNSELEKRGFLIEGDGEEGDWELPVWSGKAPKTGAWVAPHRQVEQVASEEVKKALSDTISHIILSNPQTLEPGPSQIEARGAPAIFLSQKHSNSNHAHCSVSPREVFHSHIEADGSSHAVLSAADAKVVLDRGWGERHGLSGKKGLGIPLGYVMVFAPRSTEEVETVGMIATAAARYALEGGMVK